jgi:hypothetical protein
MSVRLRIAAARLRKQRNEWSNHNHERLSNREPWKNLEVVLSSGNSNASIVRLARPEPNDRCDQCNSNRKVKESEQQPDHSHRSAAWQFHSNDRSHRFVENRVRCVTCSRDRNRSRRAHNHNRALRHRHRALSHNQDLRRQSDALNRSSKNNHVRPDHLRKVAVRAKARNHNSTQIFADEYGFLIPSSSAKSVVQKPCPLQSSDGLWLL